MELKGTVEMEETYYKRSLELAFTDYLEEDTRTPKLFRECVINRLSEDVGSDITLDEETIAQAVNDTRRFIEETLNII